MLKNTQTVQLTNRNILPETTNQQDFENSQNARVDETRVLFQEITQQPTSIQNNTTVNINNNNNVQNIQEPAITTTTTTTATPVENNNTSYALHNVMQQRAQRDAELNDSLPVRHPNPNPQNVRQLQEQQAALDQADNNYNNAAQQAPEINRNNTANQEAVQRAAGLIDTIQEQGRIILNSIHTMYTANPWVMGSITAGVGALGFAYYMFRAPRIPINVVERIMNTTGAVTNRPNNVLVPTIIQIVGPFGGAWVIVKLFLRDVVQYARRL